MAASFIGAKPWAPVWSKSEIRGPSGKRPFRVHLALPSVKP